MMKPYYVLIFLLYLYYHSDTMLTQSFKEAGRRKAQICLRAGNHFQLTAFMTKSIFKTVAKLSERSEMLLLVNKGYK